MKTLAKTAAVVAAAALAVEAGARIFIPMDALVYRDSDDAALSFELLPGASGIKNGVPVQISEQGLRDEPLSAAKAPDERRVVVVGGHETFGVGVETQNTFVRELADGLVAPGAGKARTINLSMYSYHLGQKVELACRKLPGLSPELVVLQVSEGDGGNPQAPLLRAPRLKNWLRRHSVFVRWASEKRYLQEQPSEGSGVPIASEPEPAAAVAPRKSKESAESAETRKQLRRFKECVDATGGRAVVLLLPDISAPKPAVASELRRGLEAGAKELKIPMLDARPALEALKPERRALFKKMHFLSPAAHRAVADELRRRLKPLLKNRPGPARRPSV